MKHIDLEKILQKYSCNGMREMTDERIKDCIREACEKTVDLCAENAKLYAKCGVDVGHLLNKHSILETKNQIK